MKRRFVRQFLLLGCLIMLVPAVLAACGGSEDESDDGGDTGAETTEVSDATETESEEATETEDTDDGDATGTEAEDGGDATGTEDSDATGTEAEGTAAEGQGTSTEGESAGDTNAENTWEGTITFGDFNWDSSLVHNRIAQYIVEHGYGYETETIQGNTIPIIQGMKDGQVQVTMEIWTDNIEEIWTQALDEGTLVDLGANYPESSQGWYVPTYMIEGDEERGIEPMTPDLKSVEDLSDYKDVFQDPANPDKGLFHNGVTGWQITEIIGKKLEAYGLADDYTNFLPGSSAALFSSLISAYDTGEPWLGYLWSPHWVFAQMDMTEIEQPEYTDECWEALLKSVEEDLPAPDQACDAPSVEVHVGANAEFAEQAPGIVAFLENYETTEEQTNNFLLWMQENEASVEETAIHFLNENPDVWTSWVSEEIATKVQEALDSDAGFGD